MIDVAILVIVLLCSWWWSPHWHPYKGIPSYPILIDQLNVEHVFVRFSIGTLNYIIGGVYIAPLSSPNIYESHISAVESLVVRYSNHIYVICGDYNLPEISWDNDDNGLSYSYSTSPHAPCIPESFATNGFFQFNSVRNDSNSILDLIFCSTKQLSVEKSCEPLVPIDKYHPALNLQY